MTFEQAKATALKALKLMSDGGVPPTPANFATWYTYASGTMPALNSEIDRMRLSGAPLAGAALETLHDKYLGGSDDRAHVATVSERIEEAMRVLVENLGQAEAGAQAYGATLTTLSGELTAQAGGSDPGASGGLQRLINSVVQETNRMISVNQQLEDRLNKSAQEIEKLRKDLDVVKEEAATDALTGIANRKAFETALQKNMQDARAGGGFLSLLILDIDFFKKFNDTHGHQTGDQVLKLVARMMVDVVGDRGLPARIGGEEFAVLLPNMGLPHARALAEALRGKVATKVLKNRRTGEELGAITLSIGVAEWVIGEPGGNMIERADEALYLAKRSGRNQVRTQTELEREEATRSAG
ncbi:diguanylate cyclase domain-containing protein [Novispirillum sp. DQ9]|uniref:diguanylate cyclase domain-containing protein n=1 Tax=Novispirillum sp. DQ9 TaxID=3398612 RepID=UPI003C7C85D7